MLNKLRIVLLCPLSLMVQLSTVLGINGNHNHLLELTQLYFTLIALSFFSLQEKYEASII